MLQGDAALELKNLRQRTAGNFEIKSFSLCLGFHPHHGAKTCCKREDKKLASIACLRCQHAVSFNLIFKDAIAALHGIALTVEL